MSPTTLPIYFLRDFPQKQLAVLSPTQQWAMAHLWEIQAFWWLTYTAVLTYLFANYLLLPLLAKAFPRHKA